MFCRSILLHNLVCASSR